MVRTHVIPVTTANNAALAQKHLVGPAFYLLRPDGHIGLAGGRLGMTAVADYLQSNGLRVAPEPLGASNQHRGDVELRA